MLAGGEASMFVMLSTDNVLLWMVTSLPLMAEADSCVFFQRPGSMDVFPLLLPDLVLWAGMSPSMSPLSSLPSSLSSLSSSSSVGDSSASESDGFDPPLEVIAEPFFFDIRALFAFFAGFFLPFPAFRLRPVFKSVELEGGAEGIIVKGVGDGWVDGGGVSEGNDVDGPAVDSSVDGMSARARCCSVAFRLLAVTKEQMITGTYCNTLKGSSKTLP
jgi:hypothetical protein